MPKQYLMTWQASSTRWRKWYKGQLFQVSCKELNCFPTKEASWQRANDWWRGQFSAATAPFQVLADAVRFAAKLPLKAMQDKGTAAFHLEHLLSLLGGNGSIGTAPHGNDLPADFNSPENTAAITNAVGVIRDTHLDAAVGLTYVELADKWLLAKKCSDGKKRVDRGLLKFLTDYLEQHGTPASGITAAVWEGFYHRIDKGQDADGNPWKASYKSAILKTARAFVRYLEENEYLERVPKNLPSKLLTFTVRPSEVTPASVATIRKFFAAAPASAKLQVLLGLNCGMLAKDISDLQDIEVDWTHGTITRKRSKTNKEKNCPKVTYKLWRTTFTLLKQHRSGMATVLLSPTGGKWSGSKMVSHWRAVCNTSGVKLSPKNPRTAAADMLGQHDTFMFFTDYFLGHSPRTVREKHYQQKPSDKQFFAALEWLEKQFALTV